MQRNKNTTDSNTVQQIEQLAERVAALASYHFFTPEPERYLGRVRAIEADLAALAEGIN